MISSINNPAPIVENVTFTDTEGAAIDTAIDLNGGTTKTVYCTGTVNDETGVADIGTVNASFICAAAATCEDTAGTEWTDHSVRSYKDTSCDKSTINETAAWVSCSAAFEFNAQNSSSSAWQCKIYAVDGGDNDTNSFATDTIGINSLVSVGTEDGTLAFGTVHPGTATNTSDTIENWGNVQIDVMFNGTAMSCTPGSIAVGNIGYNCTVPEAVANTVLTEYNVLTASPSYGAACDALNFDHSTTASSPSASTTSVYWALNTSSVDTPRGTCTGTIMYTGIQES